MAGGLEAQNQDRAWRDGGKARTENTTALSKLKTGAKFVVLEIANGVWPAVFFVLMADEKDDVQQWAGNREDQEEAGSGRR